MLVMRNFAVARARRHKKCGAERFARLRARDLICALARIFINQL